MLINTPLQVLTATPALHSLTIRGRKDVADILEFLNHIHCDLRKLSIKSFSFEKDSTGLFVNSVALYPNLEGLSLASCYSIPSDVYSLIPRLKKLSELELSADTVDSLLNY